MTKTKNKAGATILEFLVAPERAFLEEALEIIKNDYSDITLSTVKELAQASGEPVLLLDGQNVNGDPFEVQAWFDKARDGEYVLFIKKDYYPPAIAHPIAGELSPKEVADIIMCIATDPEEPRDEDF